MYSHAQQSTWSHRNACRCHCFHYTFESARPLSIKTARPEVSKTLQQNSIGRNSLLHYRCRPHSTQRRKEQQNNTQKLCKEEFASPLQHKRKHPNAGRNSPLHCQEAKKNMTANKNQDIPSRKGFTSPLPTHLDTSADKKPKMKAAASFTICCSYCSAALICS